MGQAVADSDENREKRFRLLAESSQQPSPAPMPLAQGSGNPPGQPPEAPAAASDPEPQKRPKKQSPKKKVALEDRVRQLEKENEQLVCALYFLQQQVKELREPK